jgi:uncharacterized integral membrane protein
MNFKIIASMTLLFVVVLFTLQNTETVSLSFFFWEFSLSRALMFFLMLSIGVLTGYILGISRKDSAGGNDRKKPPSSPKIREK